MPLANPRGPDDADAVALAPDDAVVRALYASRGASRALAECPETPPRVLARMASDMASLPIWTLHLLVSNPATPGSALTLLSQSPHADVRRSVARSPRAPVSCLRALAAEDPGPGVRAEAAGAVSRAPKSAAT